MKKLGLKEHLLQKVFASFAIFQKNLVNRILFFMIEVAPAFFRVFNLFETMKISCSYRVIVMLLSYRIGMELSCNYGDIV